MQSTFFQLPKSPLSPDHRVERKTQCVHWERLDPKESRGGAGGGTRKAEKGGPGSQVVLALHMLGSESTECLHPCTARRWRPHVW